MRLGAGWVSHPKGMLTACGGGGGRDYQGRLQDETIRDQPGADLPGGWVVWWIGQTPAAPSGREWQGAQTGQCCPASTIFAGWRQSVLPVHLLGVAPLLGCVGAVAGDVKLQDDGVMDHPVDCRGGGHGVGEDAFPLREDQV